MLDCMSSSNMSACHSMAHVVKSIWQEKLVVHTTCAACTHRASTSTAYLPQSCGYNALPLLAIHAPSLDISLGCKQLPTLAACSACCRLEACRQAVVSNDAYFASQMQPMLPPQEQHPLMQLVLDEIVYMTQTPETKCDHCGDKRALLRPAALPKGSCRLHGCGTSSSGIAGSATSAGLGDIWASCSAGGWPAGDGGGAHTCPECGTAACCSEECLEQLLQGPGHSNLCRRLLRPALRRARQQVQLGRRLALQHRLSEVCDAGCVHCEHGRVLRTAALDGADMPAAAGGAAGAARTPLDATD